MREESAKRRKLSLKNYERSHRSDKAIKNRKHYEANKDQIRKRQASHDNCTIEKKRKKEKEYRIQNSSTIKAKKSEYNKKNAHTIKKKQADYNKKNAKQIQEKQAEYNAKNSEVIRSKQDERRNEIKNNTKLSSRVLKFKTDVIEGPCFVCHVCERALFKKMVKILDRAATCKLLEKCKESFLKEVRLIGYKFFNQLILCHNCHNYIKKERVPSINVKNGLLLDEVPEELKKLSDLEHQLIQPNLIFMKIKKLPKSRMNATHDRIISVPLDSEDVTETVSKLPRHPDEAKIVAVKLKRKMELKSVHLQEYIRPKVVVDAVEKVKSIGNPFFKNITVDKEVLLKNREENDQEEEKTLQNNEKMPGDETDSDEEENDAIEHTKNPVKKFQAKHHSKTCIMPDCLETEVVLNKDKVKKKVDLGNGKSIEIAPGEGKVPTNYLRQEHFDVQSFVRHHPTGKFGLHHPRPHKLTSSMYFNQRLLNKDDRFSKDAFYVFMAAAYQERLGLEKQIDISGLKGTASNGSSGAKQLHLKDPYDVFKKLKGSPTYWKSARNDLVAKVKQLGPFHIFFTLSCGEMRWSDCFVSVLRRKGFKIKIPEDWNGDDDKILVEDKPLWDFVDQDLHQSRHELLRDYIFLITRMFDARVKSFISNILMGSGKDKIPISFYSYRIEFQVNKFNQDFSNLY